MTLCLSELPEGLDPSAVADETERAVVREFWQAADLSYLLHTGHRERELRARRERAAHEAITGGSGVPIPLDHPDLHGQEGARALFYASPEQSTVVLNVARRWGKTVLCCVLAVECALAGPNRRIAYAAPTGVMVEEFIEPVMQWLMAEAAIAGAEFVFVFRGGKRPAYVFPNGSVIRVVGCEDRKKANRLRGPFAHLCIVDEAAFVDVLTYVVRSVLAPQLLTTGGRMLITSTPPDSPAHPFLDYVTSATARGVYFHRTCYDAPHLTDERIGRYCEEAGGEDSIDWLREGLARLVVDTLRAIVPEFSALEPELVGEVERPDFFDAYVVADFGMADLTVVLFAYWHFVAGRIVVEDELVFENTGGTKIGWAIREHEPKLWPGRSVFQRVIDADPMVLRDIADEVHLHAAPPRKDNLEAQVSALRSVCQRRGILYHPRCATAIAHMRHGIWNTGRTAFARTGETGHADGVAASMYLVRSVVKQRNPFPDNFTLPLGVAQPRAAPRTSKQAEAIAKLFKRGNR